MAYGFNEDKTKANIEGIVEEAGADKVDKVAGKGLSDNNYSNADKAIVDGATAALAGKVDKVTGKGLSTNDFTNAYKTKVDESSFGVNDGSYVDLGHDGVNYYTSSNPLTCPHNGYVRLHVDNNSGSTQLNIKVTSSLNITEKIGANADYPDSWVFVKKGMKIFATTVSGGNNYAIYYPLTSNT